MRTLRPFLVALALLTPSAAALAFGATALSAPCADERVVEHVGVVCPRDDGLFEAFDARGRYLGVTHGFDARAEAPDGPSAPVATPKDPDCLPIDSPFSMRVIYARSYNTPDRSTTMVPQIREMVRQAQGIMTQEANLFAYDLKYRVQCDGSTMRVDRVVLPTPVGARNFGTVTADLRAQGFDERNTKFWVWHDDGGVHGCGGVGTVFVHDLAGPANINNGWTDAAFAVTFSCTGQTGAEVMMHENGHNMGAVQDSAPRSSGGLHCNDGRDIMCYADGGPRSAYVANVCGDRIRWDCGFDDYFHPEPPTGSYLATHWNLGGPSNLFLTRTYCAQLPPGYCALNPPP